MLKRNRNSLPCGTSQSVPIFSGTESGVNSLFRPFFAGL